MARDAMLVVALAGVLLVSVGVLVVLTAGGDDFKDIPLPAPDLPFDDIITDGGGDGGGDGANGPAPGSTGTLSVFASVFYADGSTTILTRDSVLSTAFYNGKAVRQFNYAAGLTAAKSLTLERSTTSFTGSYLDVRLKMPGKDPSEKRTAFFVGQPVAFAKDQQKSVVTGSIFEDFWTSSVPLGTDYELAFTMNLEFTDGNGTRSRFSVTYPTVLINVCEGSDCGTPAATGGTGGSYGGGGGSGTFPKMLTVVALDRRVWVREG